MKAMAHWIENEGYRDKTGPTIFDEEFAEQCLSTGRIEDSHVLLHFLKKTDQPLIQDWLQLFTQRMMKHLPFRHMFRMGRNFVLPPRTKAWGRTGDVLRQYIHEHQQEIH